ncbi:Ctr domain-containing protein [Cephalotus follicularis]|uniref:Copper transport protein n=1 Tax=Cephalotus follicularis TaxID=3775 RepID=A0A1Q3BP60_CEPFO|nr:Ctr domain-containing protein [Cephalotus follicularis]
MMHMTFYWSREVNLLFSSWSTKSWPSYALSLLACFLASAMYQYMENRRITLKLVATGAVKPGQAPMEESLLGGKEGVVMKKWWSIAKIAGAVMFGVNSGLGYLLMLAVMSFNGGVFLAVVLGLSVGYLVFRSDGEEFNKMGESLLGGKEGVVMKKWWSIAKIAGAVMFGVNSGLGYLLMLAVMSFNGGVFLAVVLGLSVGYLVFRSDGEEFNKMGVVDSPCACA